MTNERKVILDKVNELILKRKKELLKHLPSIHEIDDGIIIRFFTDWDNCHTNEQIRYKKIIDEKRPEDITIFYFLPKGAEVVLLKREYIKDIACLSGKLELNLNGIIQLISGFNKFCLDTDEFQGVALEDTYILTTNRQ
ncbi:MAG: hypothetical protein WC428_01015 [Candidatus Paceibacterota bacterium]|jgi:hypothetical protein